MAVKRDPNTTRITLISSGDDLGIQTDDSIIFYVSKNLSVSSEAGVITMVNTVDSVETTVLTAVPEAFISPSSISINELVVAIKALITMTSTSLTTNEVAAIQGADNPSASNLFVTFSKFLASLLPFTANGDITSTNVQSAIVEVRDDTDAKLALKAPLKTSFYIEKITGTPVSTTGSLVEFFSSTTGGVVARSINPTAGTYRVRISCISENTTVPNPVIINLQINSVSIFSIPFQMDHSNVANRNWVTMERRVVLTAGAQNVDINITSTGGGSAHVYEANVEITQV